MSIDEEEFLLDAEFAHRHLIPFLTRSRYWTGRGCDSRCGTSLKYLRKGSFGRCRRCALAAI